MSEALVRVSRRLVAALKLGTEPAYRWVRTTLVPMPAIPQVGTLHPEMFKWLEGTTHVHCTWGEGAVQVQSW